MSSQTLYQLHPLNYLLTHGLGPSATVQDSYSLNQEKIDVHVKSNDYFVTLATVLDLLSQEVAENRANNINETLQNIVDELLYLQRYYTITSKKHSSTKS